MNQIQRQFPLDQISETQLKRVGEVLWSWELCRDCRDGKKCSDTSCDAQRSGRLAQYYRYYKKLTGAYNPDIGLAGRVALRTHDELLSVIEALKSNQEDTRGQILDKLFKDPVRGSLPSSDDQEQALNLAEQVMLMMNCFESTASPVRLESAILHTPWRNNMTLSHYITEVFQTTDQPDLNDDAPDRTFDLRKVLTANKLKKRASLRFQGTDYITDHLKLDRKNGTVEIYHHTAFLKEHLRLTKERPRNIGALPRQLALEALDSLQKILFPLSDPKSKALLRSLISKESFDPDCIRFEAAAFRASDEKDILYLYFGANLADLYEEWGIGSIQKVERDM